MFGDQEPTGATVNVYLHKAGAIIHKQVEHKAGRTYMRVKKRPLTDLLNS